MNKTIKDSMSVFQLRNLMNGRINLSKRNNGLSIVILEKEEMRLVSQIWLLLEYNISNVSLTSKWDWVATWLRHFGTKVDFWFLVGIKDFPIGIVLLTREIHRTLPIPVKAYHFGTSGEPYQDQVRMINNKILAYDNLKTIFIESALEVIFQRFDVEELVFDQFDDGEAKVIYKILQKYPYVLRIQEEPTLYLDLESIRKSNSSIEDHFGHYMKRAIKRSWDAFDNEVSCEWADSSEKALEILDELIKLYQVTWRKLGRRGMFSSQYFLGFQRDIIDKLFKKNNIILFRVVSRKYGTVGCLYMFVDHNIAYSYQIGVNDFSQVNLGNLSNKRIKTGLMVHTMCMKECLNRGINAYNFLTGVYPYKQQMTDGQSLVVTISARKGVKPLLRNTLIDLYKKLEQRKQSLKILSVLRKIIIR